MSVPVARRQLLARPARAFAGTAGIAAALLLVLALNAIFAGMEERLTAFIDVSGADVIVAQGGVDTMHMTQSTLSEQAVAAIASVPGVAEAKPIVLVSTTVQAGDRRAIAYVVGGRPIGGRLRLVSGRMPGPGEIVLDRAIAGSVGATVGSTVETLGRSFRVSGEIEGTASIVSSVALADRAELARLLEAPGVVSYVLVRAEPGTLPGELAARIDRAVPGVTASTRSAFAASERRVVSDMTTGIVRAMTLVGFAVGVAVAALVAYSATLSQLRDYALFRALGMRARRALGLVVAQVGATVLAGFGVALALAWLLGLVLPRLTPTLTLVVRPADVAQALGVAGAVALLAAAFPVLRVARVDPASVFRR